MSRHRALRFAATAGVLAFFCLFSLGTRRWRASIHQTRSQSLVSADSDRALPAVQLNVAPTIALQPAAATPTVRDLRSEPLAETRRAWTPLRASSPPPPPRGPPSAQA